MGITPTPDCIVGKYYMYVAVVTPFGIRRTRKDDSRNLYILFNPWASGRFRLLDKRQLLCNILSHFHPHNLQVLLSFLSWCSLFGWWDWEAGVCDEWDGDHLPWCIWWHRWKRLELRTGSRMTDRRHQDRVSKIFFFTWVFPRLV